MRYSIIFSAVALITSVYADKPAEVPGMKVVWSDDFSGAEGPFDKTKWQYYDGDIYNQEEQKYPKSGDYCKLSGEGSLLITPSKDKNGQWQSCRIESIKAFAPPPGGKVMFASKFRLGAPGSTGNMKGIWPAVWTLGESKRTGTIWPAVRLHPYSQSLISIINSSSSVVKLVSKIYFFSCLADDYKLVWELAQYLS